MIGYITFGIAVVGAIASIAVGIYHAVDTSQERAYRRRTGR